MKMIDVFQIPNILVDEFLPVMSANSLKCYLVIVRYTLGYGKEEEAITSSSFMEKTGIKKSDTVWSALSDLKELGLIEVRSMPGGASVYKIVHQNKSESL